MKIVIAVPMDGTPYWEVKEIFPPWFCESVRWTRKDNYIPHGMERVIVVQDDADVQLGQMVENNRFVDPKNPTLSDVKFIKKREIAKARYEAEIGGVSVGTMQIKTDRESQAMITGAALQAVADPAYACRWKAESGFIMLNSDTIKAAAMAVRTHVQNCFDRECALVDMIDAAETIEAVRAIDWTTQTQ